MKIREKLTFQFTAIVSVILGFIFLTVYWLTALNTSNDFYEKLGERAIIAANIYLEEDEITKERYEVFQKRYLQSLTEEVIQLFDDKDAPAFIQKNQQVSFSKSTLDRVRNEKSIRYAEGDRQVVGIFYPDNQGDFVIIASAVDVNGLKKLENLRLVLLLTFFSSLVVMFLAGRFFARRALSPMLDVVQQVKSITASNLHLRVSEGNRTDEIAELAMTFNDMLKRLEQTFETQRAFVSNASHELRTPLTAIIGEIEVLLSRDRGNQDYKAALDNVLLEAHQMNQLTDMLLSLARTDSTEKRELLEEIRLDELLWDVRAEVQQTNKAADVVIEMIDPPDDPQELSVFGNRHLLASVFYNIFENALKFSENRRVSVLLRTALRGCVVTVSDTGIGIAETDMLNLFQPFFRAGNARRFTGHGVGLALSEKIIRLHNGTISVTSTLDKGTQVEIRLPTSAVPIK